MEKIKISEITCVEQIGHILEQKNIQHENVVGDYGRTWIGIRKNSTYYWIGSYGFEQVPLLAETYSLTTHRLSKGDATRSKVFSFFEKLINQ